MKYITIKVSKTQKSQSKSSRIIRVEFVVTNQEFSDFSIFFYTRCPGTWSLIVAVLFLVHLRLNPRNSRLSFFFLCIVSDRSKNAQHKNTILEGFIPIQDTYDLGLLKSQTVVLLIINVPGISVVFPFTYTTSRNRMPVDIGYTFLVYSSKQVSFVRPVFPYTTT